MTFKDICRLIRGMIDDDEPSYVYLPLPILHAFHRMVQGGPDPDIKDLFGPVIASTVKAPISWNGSLDFILVGQMLSTVSGCVDKDQGLFLNQEDALLFVKMLARPHMAGFGCRYILGVCTDNDCEDEEFLGWLEKLK